MESMVESYRIIRDSGILYTILLSGGALDGVHDQISKCPESSSLHTQCYIQYMPTIPMNRGKFHKHVSSKKKRGPLITERELALILKDVEKTAKEWETSCETQSSPHTVLCTGVLQLTTEGRDFFFR